MIDEFMIDVYQFLILLEMVHRQQFHSAYRRHVCKPTIEFTITLLTSCNMTNNFKGITMYIGM